MRVIISGPDFDTSKIKETTLVLEAGKEQGGEARLQALGLATMEEDGKLKLDEPFPGTAFSGKLGSFDFYGDDPVVVKSAKLSAEQLPKELIFIPGLLLLGLVYMVQKSRARHEEQMEGAKA
jgi:hypothetical protein